MMMTFIHKKENHLSVTINSFKTCFQVIGDAVEELQVRKSIIFSKMVSFWQSELSDNLLSFNKVNYVQICLNLHAELCMCRIGRT